MQTAINAILPSVTGFLVPISFGASTDTFFDSGWPAENKRFFDFNFLGVSYRNGAAKYAYRLCGYPEK